MIGVARSTQRFNVVQKEDDDKLSNGRSYKMLTVLDEYTCEALTVTVKSKMNNADVLEALCPLLLKHGKPTFIAQITARSLSPKPSIVQPQPIPNRRSEPDK